LGTPPRCVARKKKNQNAAGRKGGGPSWNVAKTGRKSRERGRRACYPHLLGCAALKGEKLGEPKRKSLAN